MDNLSKLIITLQLIALGFFITFTVNQQLQIQELTVQRTNLNGQLKECTTYLVECLEINP